MNDIERLRVTRRQGVSHHASDNSNDGRIQHRARADELIRGFSALLTSANVLIVIVGDETGCAADLRHHGIAGVNAKPALDTAEIWTVANVYAGGTNIDALPAIDAITRRQAMFMQCGCFF